jgi:hypothetical protein
MVVGQILIATTTAALAAVISLACRATFAEILAVYSTTGSLVLLTLAAWLQSRH